MWFILNKIMKDRLKLPKTNNTQQILARAKLNLIVPKLLVLVQYFNRMSNISFQSAFEATHQR